MTRRWLALGCLALTVGCSSSTGPSAQPSAAASPTASVEVAAPTASASACAAASADFSWPDQVPDDLPAPPGATLTEVQERDGGMTLVTFTTPISIRESVLFLLEEMPAAGYTLGRGDAESNEADVPFIKGDLRGVLRMIAVEQCRTDWLLALAATAPDGEPPAGAPLLPPRPDASPLPFG
jgi:hypothetical protein